MTKRRSPLFTKSPALKVILSIYPLTRGVTLTLSTASVRPVYSSHSTISFCTGLAMVTGGGGGAGGGGSLWQLESAVLMATSAERPASIPSCRHSSVMGILWLAQWGYEALALGIYFLNSGNF